jgi:hypothetical protein
MNLYIKKVIDLYLGDLLILILRPLTIVLGRILKRNHSAEPKGDITVIKMLGGGSLVIASASLLAIKKTYQLEVLMFSMKINNNLRFADLCSQPYSFLHGKPQSMS